MKESGKGNSEDSDELTNIINELKARGNFTGVLYIRRDGEILNESIEKPIDTKAFASMCASVLEGAMELSETMGNQNIRKIIAELNNETIIIIRIENSSFLVCILNPQSNSNLLLEDLDRYIQNIMQFS
ncbi:MAG: roadblock/LC7 domain-containing protein [Candidatus Hermodarchaeota archaeon]